MSHVHPPKMLQKLTRQEIIRLATLASLQFIMMVDFVILMPLGPKLTRDLGMDPSTFGQVVSVYAIFSGFFGFFFAQVLDWFDRKSSMIFLFLGLCVGTLACGLAHSSEALLVARGITGAFGGLLTSNSISMGSELVSPEKRGRAMGILYSSFSVAAVVGVPIGLVIANHSNWQAPFLLLTLLGFFNLALAIRVLPSFRSHLKDPDLGWRKRHKSFQNPFRILVKYLFSNAGFALLASVLMMFSAFLIIPFMPIYFTANFGFDGNLYSYAYFIGGICTFLIAQLIGKFSDRYRKTQVFTIMAGLSILQMLVITHVGSGSLLGVIPLLSSFMVLTSGRGIPLLAMVTESVKPQDRGTLVSLNQCGQNLGSGLGSFVGGILTWHTMDGKLAGFTRSGILAAALTAIGIFVGRKIRAETGARS